VAAYCGLIAQTPDGGGGCPGVCVERVEVTDLTLYHPHVALDGGVCVSQLDVESRSRAEWSADECSAPPSHPGGVPSPS
jgi:hypothetical protein